MKKREILLWKKMSFSEEGGTVPNTEFLQRLVQLQEPKSQDQINGRKDKNEVFYIWWYKFSSFLIDGCIEFQEPLFCV